MVLLTVFYAAFMLPRISVAATPSPYPQQAAPRSQSVRPRSEPNAHHIGVPGVLDVNTVLDRYRTALAAYHTPVTLTFVFTIDQVGSRGLSQTHLVYRSGLMVRNETTATSSLSIKPHIHIYRSRAHHYVIESVAPKLSAYRFNYISTRQEGARVLYRFNTSPIQPSPNFSISSVEIDGSRFLPTFLAFHARAIAGEGVGQLRYGPVDDAWMILSAEASERSGKGTIREHLVFSEYHFPASLPATTFGTASL